MIHQPVSVVSQCGAGAWLNDWLAEISADLREAVAHLRRVRDDALYKSSVALLYFTLLYRVLPPGVFNGMMHRTIGLSPSTLQVS